MLLIHVRIEFQAVLDIPNPVGQFSISVIGIGIIGKIGTLLGNRGINIASMDVGRETIGGQAVMVLTIDSSISGDVMKEILKIEGIADSKLVKM